MKRLVAILALGVAISTPAFAQTARHHARADARAQYTAPDQRAHSPNPAYDVYDTTGRYVGSDPDPTIRTMLQNDHSND
jgi:hypothetical protein